MVIVHPERVIPDSIVHPRGVVAVRVTGVGEGATFRVSGADGGGGATSTAPHAAPQTRQGVEDLSAQRHVAVEDVVLQRVHHGHLT